MNKIIKLILILILVFMVSIIMGFYYEANALDDNLVSYAQQMNKHEVTNPHNHLDISNAISEEEMRERINSIKKYSQKYNYMYPSIDAEEVFISIFSTVIHETRFVNYRELDNGMSFGWISMRWDTAREMCRKYNIDYDYEYEFYNNDMQGKMVVRYFYRSLQKFNGDINKSIIAYNRGIYTNFEEYKYRKYFYEVNGIKNYIIDDVVDCIKFKDNYKKNKQSRKE